MPAKRSGAWLLFALLIAGLGYWAARAAIHRALNGPIDNASSTVATTPGAVAAAKWTEVALPDLIVDLPGRPEESTTTKTINGLHVSVHEYKVTRGPMATSAIQVMDIDASAGWDAARGVDGAAKGALEGGRTTEGTTSFEVVVDERRALAGMVGRVTEARAGTTDGRTFTIHAAYYSRANSGRVYQIMAAGGGQAEAAEARAVMASIRAPKGAPAIPQRPQRALPSGDAGTTSPSYAPQAETPTTETPPSYGYDPTPQAPAYHGPVQVRGYTRQDGTYVQPHTRSAPHRR